MQNKWRHDSPHLTFHIAHGSVRASHSCPLLNGAIMRAIFERQIEISLAAGVIILESVGRLVDAR